MKYRNILGALAIVPLFLACSADDAGDRSKSGDDAGDGDGQPASNGVGATSGSELSIGASADGDYYLEGGVPNDEGPSAMGGAAAIEPVGANPFVVVGHDPLSTFAADVDTASYDIFRARVAAGILPPASQVRLEEFVNYFEYEYAGPAANDPHPFKINLAAAPSLSTRKTQLLRVGIQGLEVAPEEKKPANLVFLVDVSGSMSGNMEMVKTVLRETLKILDPTDTISIVTYASDPGTALVATPVSNSEKIIAAIDGLASGGSTNGSGGINAAYAEAEGAFIEGGINHVLLCTDGDFNVGLTSSGSLEDLIIEKRATGITLTALGFGYSNDAMMEQISNAGNGIYGYIGDSGDAKDYAQTRMLQSLVHIAKDMKIQVEFNADHVYAYRLLGYENRAIADNDFRNDVVDAGEIGSGHRVTALYELVMTEADLPSGDGAPSVDDGSAYAGTPEVAAGDLVLVKVRYKQPDASEADPATEVSSSMTPEEVAVGFEGAGGDLQWAAAVAAFAEILKESSYATPEAIGSIRTVIEAQASRDDDRTEFQGLFESAVTLLGLN